MINSKYKIAVGSSGYVPNGDSLAMLLGNSIQPFDHNNSDNNTTSAAVAASMMTPLPLQLLNHQQV
jgi:hypothetical protein